MEAILWLLSLFQGVGAQLNSAPASGASIQIAARSTTPAQRVVPCLVGYLGTVGGSGTQVHFTAVAG